MLHKSPGVDRKRQDIEDGLHQYKRQQSLGSWISSDHCSLCIAEQLPPLPKSLACVFSLSHSLFSFCPTLCHFFSTIIFLQIFKDYIWGLGDGDDNKHTSWQTCVCANRVLEHCLNILTMRRSQKSNSKHALLYF